jgi:hypothetical protein
MPTSGCGTGDFQYGQQLLRADGEREIGKQEIGNRESLDPPDTKDVLGEFPQA